LVVVMVAMESFVDDPGSGLILGRGDLIHRSCLAFQEGRSSFFVADDDGGGDNDDNDDESTAKRWWRRSPPPTAA
jgi:hypothetical protein